jgi:hypothetical protein
MNQGNHITAHQEVFHCQVVQMSINAPVIERLVRWMGRAVHHLSQSEISFTGTRFILLFLRSSRRHSAVFWQPEDGLILTRRSVSHYRQSSISPDQAPRPPDTLPVHSSIPKNPRVSDLSRVTSFTRQNTARAEDPGCEIMSLLGMDWQEVTLETRMILKRGGT